MFLGGGDNTFTKFRFSSSVTAGGMFSFIFSSPSLTVDRVSYVFYPCLKAALPSSQGATVCPGDERPYSLFILLGARGSLFSPAFYGFPAARTKLYARPQPTLYCGTPLPPYNPVWRRLAVFPQPRIPPSSQLQFPRRVCVLCTSVY